MIGLTGCCKCAAAIRQSDYGRSACGFQTVKSIPKPIDIFSA